MARTKKTKKTFHHIKVPNNFLGLPPELSGYEKSGVVVLPVGYEHTVSYLGGTGKAPAAIIKASRQVEFYCDDIDDEIVTRVGGIYTAKAPKLSKDPETMVHQVYQATQKFLTDGKFVITLGGEHSITTGTIRAFEEKFDDYSILHFDAHSDLRDSYEGTPYSHASVMARVYPMNPNLVQIGIRSQCIEERDFIRKNRIKTHYARDMWYQDWHQPVIEELKPKVYVTIDCDYFDPALLPALGTPEPGGFFYADTITFLKKLCAQREVIGFDFVELAPMKGMEYADFITARMIYKFLGFVFHNKLLKH